MAESQCGGTWAGAESWVGLVLSRDFNLGLVVYCVARAVVLPGGMALAVGVGASGEGIEDSFYV